MTGGGVLRDQLRLIGVTGSNRVMAGELSRLVRRAFDDVRVPIPAKQGPGALSYPFDERMALVAVRHHRTSARVLWERYRTRATRLEPLYDELRAAILADPRPWFWDGATLSVSAFAVQRFAAGERQVVGTVKNAVIDAARELGVSLAVDPERPAISIDVRLVGEELSVALDLAGMPMHRRGYRSGSGPAPLREDLAALVVMLARHDCRSEVLLDPMAGSGTLGIEAACLGQGRLVWCSGRHPACESWPALRPLFEREPRPIFGDTRPFVISNEADEEAVATLRRNVLTAGVEPLTEIVHGDFRALDRSSVAALAEQRGFDPNRGVIVCNPPYGHRLSDEREAERTFRDLARWMRQFSGWRAAFIVAHRGFVEAMGVAPRIEKPLENGPLKAMFYLYDL